MSVSLWAYTPEKCDGDICVGDCDLCGKAEEEENRPTRRGRWKGEHKRGAFSHPDSITYECSECGYSMYTIYGFPHLPNYCPNCGARMEAQE